MNPRIRKVIDWVVGLTLIAIGIPLVVLPGPAILFFLAGLAVLSSHSRWARAIHERIKHLGRRMRERVTHHDRHD